jgi:hypothetical protein
MRLSASSLAWAAPVLVVIACSSAREPPDNEEFDDGGGLADGSGSTTGTLTPTSGSSAASTSGAGGMGVGGAGGAPATPPEAMYQFCGCISDRNLAGACDLCWQSAFTPTGSGGGGGGTPNPQGQCDIQYAGCAQSPECIAMLNALQACGVPVDAACVQSVWAMDPNRFDDVVALVTCACTACPPIDFCDTWSCQP